MNKNSAHTPFRLEQAARAWGSLAFEGVLKREIAANVSYLPLHQALAVGNHVADEPVTVLLNSITETDGIISIRAGIFFKGLLLGCSCSDDPSGPSESNEYCEIEIELDRSGKTTIDLLATTDLEIDPSVSADSDTIQPQDNASYDLNTLVSGINPDNTHGEISFGNPVGKEIDECCKIQMVNLFENLSPAETDERIEVLQSGAAVRIERIVSWGQASPEGFWYDQMEDEWVCLVSGQARLKLREPDESLDLRPGDCLFISAHRQHRVEWTSHSTATVWLAVFSQQG